LCRVTNQTATTEAMKANQHRLGIVNKGVKIV
jgi:hypothetical protein